MSRSSSPSGAHADELAELLVRIPHPQFETQPDGDRAYTVLTAIAEIQEWLEVQPTLNQQRQPHRDSLLADIAAAFTTLGPAVGQLTPSAAPLLQSMEVLLKPPAQGDPAAAQGQLDELCAELADAATAAAAFDDLNEVVSDRDADPSAVANRSARRAGINLPVTVLSCSSPEARSGVRLQWRLGSWSVCVACSN